MKSNDYLGILLRFFIAPLAIVPALYCQPSPTTFQTSTINVGCNPLNVLSGDFNGDRIPDLAYACSATSANPIMVLLGNGDGTFHTTATIGAVEPGIFSVGYGTGQAIAINSDGSLTASANSIPGYLTRPAKPGETIIILATGLGAVDQAIATGAASSDALRNTTVIPSVLINGTPATVAFHGLSPQFVGVNQLNVVVPSVSAGVVSLQIDAAGVRTTDKVTIAIANQ
jgi:uncharacterized protein (TIGR03437 family)